MCGVVASSLISSKDCFPIVVDTVIVVVAEEADMAIIVDCLLVDGDVLL